MKLRHFSIIYCHLSFTHEFPHQIFCLFSCWIDCLFLNKDFFGYILHILLICYLSKLLFFIGAFFYRWVLKFNLGFLKLRYNWHKPFVSGVAQHNDSILILHYAFLVCGAVFFLKKPFALLQLIINLFACIFSLNFVVLIFIFCFLT